MYGRFLDNRFFHFAAFCLALAIGMSQNFVNGLFPLGGDGDFHLAYSGVLRYFFSWSEDGLGLPNYAVEAVWSFPVILSFLEAGLDTWGVKLFLNYSLYLLWFASAYLVCSELKVAPFRSFLLALFFVLNPFSLSYLSRLNMSLTIAPAAMMIFFWVIARFYGQGLKLFFSFGVLSTLLAFANTNPPLMVIIQLSVLISVLVAGLLKRGRLDVKEALSNYGIVLSSFALFNAWWLVNLYSFISSGVAARMYTSETAGSFLDLVVSSTDLILPRALTLRTGFTTNGSENFFGYFYNSAPAVLLSAIPLASAGVYAAVAKERKNNSAIFTALFACLISAFLAKGTDRPLGVIYAFLFEYAPFFNIFKGPIEKFGMLFLFTLTLLLALVSMSIRNGRAFDALLCAYVLFFSIPLLTGHLFPESSIGIIKGYTTGRDVESLLYRDRPGFKETREFVNGAEGDFRVLAFPANKDYYATTFRMYDNRIYSGVDPLYSNTKRPFLIYGKATDGLYSEIRHSGHARLLGLYGIGIVSVDGAAIPRYGFANKETPEEQRVFFGEMFPSRSFGEVTVFDARKELLPRIYASGWRGMN